ncbi:hypothetical protein BLOT_013916, partial [Blomia tropicalis]
LMNVYWEQHECRSKLMSASIFVNPIPFHLINSFLFICQAKLVFELFGIIMIAQLCLEYIGTNATSMAALIQYYY